MVHDFSRVPRANISRSSFDRSHGLKTTFDAGYIIPIYFDEALPGDTVTVREALFGRLATPLHPVMDNMRITTQYYAVPLRLLWDNWQRFNGEQDNPDDSTDYLMPEIEVPAGGYDNGSIFDYFGLPTQVGGYKHRACWLRAYNLIYNQWYRDENLQDSVPVPKDDGPDDPALYQLLKRGKRHDYFTSCLPFPQKGPAVELPLGVAAPVVGLAHQDTSVSYVEQTLRTTGGQTVTASYTSSTMTPRLAEDPDNPGFPNVYADLADATAATINSLRNALSIQHLFEKDARGGTRYTEIVRSHFGVVSPDARLQRPEYLGGGVTPVRVTQVPNTAGDPGSQSSFVGELGGYGEIAGAKNGFTKSFTEHCVLVGFACLTADLTYQKGLNRMWSRSTRYDFFWPDLQNLGEQEVRNKEIFTQGTAVDDEVFGYQERYAEYRYNPSYITGQFRSNFAQSLDTWHLSQDFANLPVLNAEFIEEDPPVDRVVAVPDYPDVILDCYFQERWARPMPIYSVPGLTRF